MTEEQTNRAEHREDQRDYLKDRREDEHKRVHRRDAIREGESQGRWKRAAAYVLILGVTSYGFWSIDQESKDRCENAQVNRTALLDTVTEIRELGRDLVGASQDTAPTPEQLASLARFREFEDELRARLDVPVCDEDGNPVVPG